MADLITISKQMLGQETVQTVNARDLHAFLEIGKDFSNWIKDRISKYEFTEGSDYTLTLAKIGERQNVVLKEYHLSLNMAKELSMVERNEKGRQARQYFIECERQAMAPTNVQEILNDPNHLKTLLLNNVEKVIALESKVKEQEPKVAAYEHLTRADGTMCITNAAKALEVRPRDLFTYLSQNKWIYKRMGSTPYIPYQEKIQSGLMDCPTTTISRGDGSEKIAVQARVTSKGLARLAEALSGDSSVQMLH
ncbi:anti-repressor protein [Bartonella australis AUST/NH1]|uniref:Anti-repressor protein n=1 Tax=Bartonella australis (strain Aust/NH1) TaxID=1094489 RepID=M1NXE7_BARAA|nr:phage antirepressor Ant [Bartonella australis]AGF74147.1 anti-repressor protein [Bartonella australis AUST/NH1]